jgi:hypothetical protein
MRLIGWKGGPCLTSVEVVYKGPFTNVRDEEGSVLRRGEQVRVGRAEAERLRCGPSASQFALRTS